MSTSPLSAARRHLGAVVRIQPGRPAIMLGVRTALATAVPLLVAPHVAPWAAAWASTGGFIVAIADKGGSYRTRAFTMGSITIGVGLAVAAGGRLSPYAFASVAFMLVWAALWSFVRILGPTASGGISAAVAYSIAVATPHAGLDHAIAATCGGAWAMGLALVLWPVRVYRPGRLAVARCFDALAAQTRRIDDKAPDRVAGHATIRVAIEAAREILAESRRGRQAESGRGALLLVLVQLAELLFGSLMALEAELEESPLPTYGLAQAFEQVADRIEDERASGEVAGWQTEVPSPILERLRDNLRLALDTAGRLRDARPSPETVFVDVGADMPTLRERVRDNLTFRSVPLRHALRVAITASVAMIVARALHLHRGYWVTLTVLVLLEPYTTATAEKALQRLVGTVLGGVLAAVVLVGLGAHPVLLSVVAMALAGCSAAVLQLNYALYSFLLTPTFVLLAESNAHDGSLPLLRIVNTLLGGALALVSSRLLWPHREGRQLPLAASDALRGLRAYFDELHRVVVQRVPPPVPTLLAARRRFGLDVSAADASFQRVLSEVGTRTNALEPPMTMLLFVRRCGATIGSIAASRVASPPSVDAIAGAFDAVLDDLIEALRDGRQPAALPSITPPSGRSDRLWQQLVVLHGSVTRWQPTLRHVR